MSKERENRPAATGSVPVVPAEKPKKKMKTGSKVLIAILCVFAAAIVAFCVYAFQLHKSDTFFRNSTAEGVDISGKTPDEVSAAILDSYQDSSKTVDLEENGKTVLSGKLSDYGVSINEEQLKKNVKDALETQKNSARAMLGTLTGNNQVSIQIPYTIDDSVFTSFVTSDNLSVERTQPSDAKVAYDESQNKVVVQQAVKGDVLDDAKMQASVKEQLQDIIENWTSAKSQKMTIPEDAYVEADVQEATDEMQAEADALNEYAGAKITYTFGDQTEVLDYSTIMSWMDISNGTVTLNDDKVKAYVEELAKKYNTRGVERTFHTTGGQDITIAANLNSYGYRIDQDAEVEQLKKDIESKQEVTREPVYVSTNSYGNPYYLGRNGTDDLNGTYIEVDITKQHFWFYKNGNLVVDSDVVTGDVTKNRGTVTGVFPIAYKRQNTTLSGSTGEYNTKVSYWMPFYDGQGFHDAWWRSSFGGSIYRGNGSHGCVNLPSSVAKTLYENVDTGTAVILYKS